MDSAHTPRPYPEWRKAPADREEDAAYLFGYFLIKHCRDEALAVLPTDASGDLRATVVKSVDTALHNVCDLLEGFWRLDTGQEHRAELVLTVRVVDAEGAAVERQEIAPCKLDLPIGYWKWAVDREFR